jgi:hypothetical protein
MLAGIAGAQESRGTIQGTVKDPLGGAVPDATIVVTNTDTGAAVHLKSNATGRYAAPLLLPGNYSISAQAAGFRNEVRSGVVLQLSDVRDVDIALQVGVATDSVTVTTEAPLVDVARTDAGRVLDDRSIRDLPVMANSVVTMIQYGAGVQTGGPPILLGPHSTQGGSDYSNGSGVGGNTYSIDGAINNGNGRNTANLPSVEGVSETKIINSTFDGSFGHATGLGIAVSTKTGTNDFHGVASENYWSQRWQGTNLFTKKTYYSNIDSLLAQGNTAGAQAAEAKPIQPSGHSHLYGLNATGPIWIPHVLDLRNKVFWSFSFNGEHDAKPEDSSTYNRTVPSASEKKGDFSDMLGITSDGLNYQLYDPLSVKVDTSRTGTHYIRTPLPGNILPASYINMGAKTYNVYTKYWPDPNNWFDHTKSQTTGATDYQSGDTPYNWLFKAWSGRLDMNLGSKMRLFGRYTVNDFVEYRGDWTHNIVTGYNNQNVAGSGVTRDDQNGVLDWVYTLSPSTILHASAAVSNWVSWSTTLPYAFQFKPSDAGIATYVDQRCGNYCYLPLMTVSGYSQNGISGTIGPQYNRDWAYNGDVYYNHGNHAFRAGVDIRQQTRSIHNGNNASAYTFGNTYFREYDDGGAAGTYNPATVGLSWASFMMGLPNAINMSDSASFLVSNQYRAGFIQDTWRATPKLTVTLSLRGEWENGAKGKLDNWISGFDPTAVLPISAGAQAAYAASPIPELAASQFVVTGGPLYAGTSGAPERAWDSQLVWLPRAGFGYQLDSKTVIRGGYGIYYDTLDVNSIVYAAQQSGYSRTTNTTITTTNGVTWGSNGVMAGNPAALISPLTDPFPVRPLSNNTRFDEPLGNILGNMGILGISGGPGGQGGTTNWTVPPSKHPRMQRWRFGIERQIGTTNLVSFGYTGAYTSDLNVAVNASPIPASYYYFGGSRPMTSAGATISCNAGVTNASANNCLEDTNLGANVTNPFYIGNFASLQTSNPTLYAAMSSAGSFFSSTTISKASLLRAYPSSNITLPHPIGHERETEFDLAFNRRFSRGLTANVSYTYFDSRVANSYLQPWSGLDPASPQQLYWGPNNIAPHRITATWVYDLPFGKSRQWVHSTIPAALVGGWTIAGTYQYQMGTLIQMPNAFYAGDPRQIKISDTSIGQWFNTTGCVLTAAQAGPGDTVVPLGQPCTAGWDKRTGAQPGTYQARVIPLYVDGVRNPGIHQTNVSLSRDFRFHERFTFQARIDALNVMNHSFMGGVNTGVTGGLGVFGAITSGGATLNRFIQIQGHIRW